MGSKLMSLFQQFVSKVLVYSFSAEKNDLI
jgi:hypothetical protein